jgi:hypothetical protein
MYSRPALMVLAALVFIPLVAPAQIPPAVAAGSPTPADDRPSREQVLKLFEAMQIRTQMEDMLKKLPAALEQQLQSEEGEVELNLLPAGGGELTADQKAARDKVTDKYFAMSERLYPLDEMLSDMVEVYQRHLSREDVDGILAFYLSTPGRHLVQAQPLMASEVMPAVMKKLEARNRELVERYKKELNDVMGPPKVQPLATPKS